MLLDTTDEIFSPLLVLEILYEFLMHFEMKKFDTNIFFPLQIKSLIQEKMLPGEHWFWRFVFFAGQKT